MQWWIQGRGLDPPYFQSKLRHKGPKKKKKLDRAPHLSQVLVNHSQIPPPHPLI